jgi:hypothetical protein
MADPVRDPETGGRPLADILREAGIENPSRTGRRRRWDDLDDTGIRQRRPDGDREEPGARTGYGRRAGDVALDRPDVDPSSGMARVRDSRFRRPQPGDARSAGGPSAPSAPSAPAERGRTGPRDDRARPDRPREERLRLDRPRQERPRQEVSRDTGRDLLRDPVRDTGRRAPVPAESPRTDRGDGGPSTAAIPGLRPSRTPAVPAPVGAPATGTATATTGTAAAVTGQTPVRERRHRAAAPPVDATGPLPAVDATGEIPAAPRESALAWLRFAGELVIAAAVGVGVYFAFTVLWELVPHLAVVASPLVVTGLVLGVGAWRQRSGRGPVGTRLLGALVFAGTILTILPAAGLISS